MHRFGARVGCAVVGALALAALGGGGDGASSSRDNKGIESVPTTGSAANPPPGVGVGSGADSGSR